MKYSVIFFLFDLYVLTKMVQRTDRSDELEITHSLMSQKFLSVNAPVTHGFVRELPAMKRLVFGSCNCHAR